MKCWRSIVFVAGLSCSAAACLSEVDDPDAENTDEVGSTLDQPSQPPGAGGQVVATPNPCEIACKWTKEACERHNKGVLNTGQGTMHPCDLNFENCMDTCKPKPPPS